MEVIHRMSVVLIWRSAGPYHLARAVAAAQALKPRNIRVVLVELSDQEATRDWIVDRSACGVEIRTLLKGKLDSRTPSMAPGMIQLLDELQPRCVAVAGYDRTEMRAAVRWAGSHRAVSILMSETKWDDNRRPWWKQMILRRWLRQIDAGLVSGGAAGEFLVAMGVGREKIFRHYGAVDNAYFTGGSDRLRALPRPAGIPAGDYFVASSRLIESRKNLRRLIEAHAIYRRGIPRAWPLVICGDGADRTMLEQHAQRQGDTDVIFAGFQQVDRLAAYYAFAGAFVHSAVNEAWGLVVNEAMACGLPVLVSRRCGCAYDLVHEGVNGWTFDPADPQAIAEQMRIVAALSPQQRQEMGQASRRIISRFGPEQFAQGLCDAMRHIKKSVTAR